MQSHKSKTRKAAGGVQASDPMCAPLKLPGQKPVFGAAAREKRIAALGGTPDGEWYARQADAILMKKLIAKLGPNVTPFRRIKKSR